MCHCPAATLNLHQRSSSEVHDENTPPSHSCAMCCCSSKTCPSCPTRRREDAAAFLICLATAFSLCLFSRPCAPLLFSTTYSVESGREQMGKKHPPVTKPSALRRCRAQQALRLPPELRACVCPTQPAEWSRMRRVQWDLVRVCATAHPLAKKTFTQNK